MKSMKMRDAEMTINASGCLGEDIINILNITKDRENRVDRTKKGFC
jgi:hypothetical protein